MFIINILGHPSRDKSFPQLLLLKVNILEINKNEICLILCLPSSHFLYKSELVCMPDLFIILLSIFFCHFFSSRTLINFIDIFFLLYNHSCISLGFSSNLIIYLLINHKRLLKTCLYLSCIMLFFLNLCWKYF